MQKGTEIEDSRIVPEPKLPAMPGGLSPLRGPEVDVRFQHDRASIVFLPSGIRAIQPNLSFDTARLLMAIL